MVCGKTSQILDQALVALKDSRDENKELREMIKTMAESQKALVIKSQVMDEKIEVLILSQQQASTENEEFLSKNDQENDGAIKDTRSQHNDKGIATLNNSQAPVKHTETNVVNHIVSNNQGAINNTEAMEFKSIQGGPISFIQATKESRNQATRGQKGRTNSSDTCQATSYLNNKTSSSNSASEERRET
jgi:hypothetical protein